MTPAMQNGHTGDSALTLDHAREFLKAGRTGEAEAICRSVLQTRPEDAPALYLLGILTHRRGDTRAGIELIERAAGRPDAPSACFVTLAQLYGLDGRLDHALNTGRIGVQRQPDAPQAIFNLGAIHFERGELGDAAACFRQAQRLDPNFAPAHLDLGHILLLIGDFRAGWIEYEWRFRLETTRHLIPRFPVPLWDGGPRPGGRILVIGDQGYGDTIQFARYVPMAAERCREILVGCSPELLPLISTVPGVGRCFVRWEHIPPFDAYCAVSSLPGLFKTELASIPGAVPYLRSDPVIVRQWADRLEPACGRSRLRVGVVWAGRPSHPRDRLRSMRWTELQPLEQIPGVALIALQKDIPAGDRPDLARSTDVIDVASALTDFSQTAAALENIDLLVAVDSSVAHLAGALGKPVWLMLPWMPDWRWMLDRDDNPWYPTMRLFRQRTRGDWAGVVARVANELRAVVDGDRGKLMPIRQG